MNILVPDRLDAAMDALPHRYPGPGGVAGVLSEGRVVASRAWGYADLEARRPMTSTTRLPICSISKQFTCGVLLDKFGDFAKLDGRVGAFLPAYQDRIPTVTDLCHNQSGLRDYWALTVLQGASAEQTFRREDALPLIAQMRTGQFEPGTRYSYCNANFRMLSEMIESETGASLEQLYREAIWDPACMETALLRSDTRRPADDVVGYEGTEETGYFPANNGIFWVGDAGISASLNDMLAYEAWIDATRDNAEGLYRRLSRRPNFRGGGPASYGYGLAHGEVAGAKVTGHAGALRGFRAYRMHAAAERISVVVLFNHDTDFFGAAASLLKAALGRDDPALAPMPDGWEGQWICGETGLLARLTSDRYGATLRYATFADRLTAQPDGSLASATASLVRDGANLTMRRADENLVVTLEPLTASTGSGDEIDGRYESIELGATMVIEARDGGVYAGFEGMLGRGPMERVHPAGPDVWVVATRRSMDAPAPGDWTLRVRRDAAGRATGATLGCWLARGIEYARTA